MPICKNRPKITIEPIEKLNTGHWEKNFMIGLDTHLHQDTFLLGFSKREDTFIHQYVRTDSRRTI